MKGLRLIAVLTILLCTQVGNAQYFGKNKVNYRTFNFTEWWTPHFKIHHYFDDKEVPARLGRQSEKWYKLHQNIFLDSFKQRNPLIFYANHGDFQQTTAIGGQIGVGTGGVTEGLRTRVVMPLMMSDAETNHVLGHEMVHVFQYKMFKEDSSLGLQRIQNVPIWMIEGLAEYLSIGRADAHTAMWMRDAVANDDVPTIKELTRRPDKYFPYRYGHAFWSFIGGTYGDGVIKPLLYATGRYGLDRAIDSLFGVDQEKLSQLWKNTLVDFYGTYDTNGFEDPAGDAIVTEENAGELNIAPNISPDGEKLLFLSEKGVFSIDYFLADAKTGEIKKKVASSRREGHIDAFSFVESAGAWAPDSRRFIFVVYSKGQNIMKMVDATNGKDIREFAIPGVRSFRNPTWSPAGDRIVVSGQRKDHSDLYAYDLTSRKTTNLTADKYSDIQPSFSPDGKKIVFATDRLSKQMNNPAATDWFNISILNMETGEVTNLPVFPGANNLNPVFSPDGKSIYFLSDRDGFRNLYRYEIESNSVFQLTNLFTGITGVTTMAPAISVARESGEIAYTYYTNDKYEIFTADPSAFTEEKVGLSAVNMRAAILPPEKVVEGNVVTENLSKFNAIPELPDTATRAHKYTPNFKLEYIGNTQIGVSSSSFGTGAAGGISMLFGDILGHNKLFTSLSINGEIYDAAGQVFYLNQKNRIHWGVGISHIPLRYGGASLNTGTDSINGQEIPTLEYVLETVRIFEDRFNASAQYPFNRTKRLEVGGSFARYYYQRQQETLVYDQTGTFLLDRTRESLPTPSGFNLFNVNSAYVGDNAYFGIASPLDGYRFRIQADRYFGQLDYWNLLVDLRKYFYVNPFTVAFRSYNMSRIGVEQVSFLNYPLFAGYPSLIHGYYSMFFGNTSGQFPFQKLQGQNIHVGNIELRLPFTGPERLALIRSRYLLTEISLFADAALAYNDPEDVIYDFEKTLDGEDSDRLRAPVFSTGVALRINLFGQLVVEPYYAFALQHPTAKNGTFGLNISPGW